MKEKLLYLPWSQIPVSTHTDYRLRGRAAGDIILFSGYCCVLEGQARISTALGRNEGWVPDGNKAGGPRHIGHINWTAFGVMEFWL